MSKKKNRKKNKISVEPITAHDCRAEIKSPARGRFKDRDSDRPDGVTGNYS